jgi:type II secretory pathway pseudopilin PulG
VTVSQQRAAGFTLVELTVVLALTLPVLLVVLNATQAVTGSFKATETASREAGIAQNFVTTLDSVFRGGRHQTLQVIANSKDVLEQRAAQVGDWCSMIQADPRKRLRVDTTTGDQGPKLLIPVSTNELAFVSDPGEPSDGKDNDKDGLFDEGTLQWKHDGITSVIARNVEVCTFELDGQAILATLHFAVPGHGGKWRRTTFQHTVRLNNP